MYENIFKQSFSLTCSESSQHGFPLHFLAILFWQEKNLNNMAKNEKSLKSISKLAFVFKSSSVLTFEINVVEAIDVVRSVLPDLQAWLDSWLFCVLHHVGSLKQKRPNELEQSNKAARTDVSKQLSLDYNFSVIGYVRICPFIL